jgi:NADH-quinone oxidoreductase subunit A
MNINFCAQNLALLEKQANYLTIQCSAMQEEYLSILIYLIFATFLSCFIVTLSYFLVTQNPETEKLSTYECGFEPYGDSRNKFNIRFYIIAILFILFDIEIIFMLPWCVSISKLNLLGFWSVIEFLTELGIGFIYVWSVGALKWS